MKLLHVNFHKGCESDIAYVFKKLGHTVESWRFDDGETYDDNIYKITYNRAQKCWDKHQHFFNTFDGIITSDTCPTSRPFLQNNWSKLLIIWVCNRFDYAVEGDTLFYELLRTIPNRSNVYIIGYTIFENIYFKQIRNIHVTDLVIKPIGKNIISDGLCQNYNNKENIFYVPTYENETKFMNLSEKLSKLGIQNKCERYSHVSELLEYKGIICLPYAWSTLTFFEVMQLGIVYFVPTLRFIVELMQSNNVLRQRYWFQPPHNYDQHLLRAAEWYCDEHKDLIVYFDSWEDLQEKVKTTDYESQTQKIIEFAQQHATYTLSMWNNIIIDYTSKNDI
uniref:Glycosyltransferase n=1 Tax=viral metagenome TaxID=1070528 RepID=A0A6C0E202_9ZZZZ